MARGLLVSIPAGAVSMEGMLAPPATPIGVVLFAHGSGSDRFSPRNNQVAAALREAGMGTLLPDLLTPGKEARDQHRFDIEVLADSSAGIAAVASVGGRPDLAGAALARVLALTLLIVGGDDGAVLDLNRQAYAALTCGKSIEIVPGASHVFEDPWAQEQVATLASHWFVRHFD